MAQVVLVQVALPVCAERTDIAVEHARDAGHIVTEQMAISVKALLELPVTDMTVVQHRYFAAWTAFLF